jgi:hypothetical protein
MFAPWLIVPSWLFGVGEPIFTAISTSSFALGAHVMLSAPARVKLVRRTE